MQRDAVHCPPVVPRPVLGLFVAALLLTSFSGHAGVQVLDGALLAKLYHVHQHGVPGERAYIATHGTWEGFVHPHCHRQHQDGRDSQPGPDHVQAAASLASAALCASWQTTPLVPVAAIIVSVPSPAPGAVALPRPLLPPPQA